MVRSAATAPSRRLNFSTSSTMSAVTSFGSATSISSTGRSFRARLSAMKPSMKSLAISAPEPARRDQRQRRDAVRARMPRSRYAIAPPSEWPTRCADAIPAASM